jgi:hypothetical protein
VFLSETPVLKWNKSIRISNELTVKNHGVAQHAPLGRKWIMVPVYFLLIVYSFHWNKADALTVYWGERCIAPIIKEYA